MVTSAARARGSRRRLRTSPSPSREPAVTSSWSTSTSGDPGLTRLLHLPDGPGITDLARNRITELMDALQACGVTSLSALGYARPRWCRRPGAEGWRSSPAGGPAWSPPSSSRVRPGRRPPRAAGLRGDRALDVPPILATGDAMAITGKVDAILACRPPRDPHAADAAASSPESSERSPAPVLGLVATGAELDEGYPVYAAYQYIAGRGPGASRTSQPPME